MPIKSLTIQSLGPFSRFSTDLPAIALVQGGNGQGKTGVLECLRYLGARGHDPSMLHGAAESGEITVTLDTGHQLRARVIKDRTERSWKAPDARKWTIDRTMIDELLNAAGYDPIRFLDLTAPEQAKELLRLAPVEMAEEELTACLSAVPEVAAKIPFRQEMNALERVDLARTMLYETRTQAHQSAQSLEAHVEELRRALPVGNGGDAQKQHAEAMACRASLEQKQQASIATVNAEYQRTKADAAAERMKAHGEAERMMAEKLREYERQLAQECAAAKEAANAHEAHVIEEARQVGQQKADAIRAENAAVLQRLTQQVADLEAAAKLEAQAEGTRQAIETGNRGAAQKREEWKALDNAVKALDALRQKLADRLPLKGIMVREGRIVREQDGGLVPFARWNEADQVQTCLRIGMMVGNKAGLVILDHMERFEKKRRDALMKSCAKYVDQGYQFLMCRVDDEGGSLTISDGREE